MLSRIYFECGRLVTLKIASINNKASLNEELNVGTFYQNLVHCEIDLRFLSVCKTIHQDEEVTSINYLKDLIFPVPLNKNWKNCGLY